MMPRVGQTPDINQHDTLLCRPARGEAHGTGSPEEGVRPCGPQQCGTEGHAVLGRGLAAREQP